MRLRGCVIAGRFFAMAFLLLASGIAVAQQPVGVDSALSQEAAGVGEPVQFTITVRGSQSAEVPRNFAVDGLRVMFRGQSSSINVINFQMSSTSTYTFLIVPEREGVFRIPSLAVSVDGQTYQTAEQVLEVRGTAAVTPGLPQQAPVPPGFPQLPGMPQNPFRPPGAPPPPTTANEPEQVPVDKVAFAQLIVPEGGVFVGQVVPVEIKIFLDSRFRFNLNQLPAFSGEGFTAEKLSDPVERTQVVDGVQYNVVTFRSAITPVKAGELEISPVRLNCDVIVQSGNRGSLFDDFFGGADPFSGMFGEARPLEVVSNSAKLSVAALPRDGRPPGFGGAIGKFSLDVAVRPARGQIGEPLKLVISVTGEGNFSAIRQPEVLPDPAWRVYSGSEQFVPADAAGRSGTKTFEVTMMALKETSQTPAVEFSYFDPDTGKYVTLKGGPEPVTISGGQAPPAPTPIQKSAPSTASGPAPAPSQDGMEAATPDQPDALSQSNQGPVILSQWHPGSFVPVLRRPEFLVANAAAFFALLCFLLYLVYSSFQRSGGGRLRDARASQNRLLRNLSEHRENPAEFYGGAFEFLLGQMQIHRRNWDIFPDPHKLPEDASLPDSLRAEISTLLRAHDETKFSTVGGTLDASKKDAVLATLREFQKLRP